MAVVITKTPNEYSFVGNSIVFEFSADFYAIVKMNITAGNNTYSAAYYPYKIAENQFIIHADISDYLKFESNTGIQPDGIIIPVAGFSLPYQVGIFDERDKLIHQFSGTAFRGGISNRSIRKLEENGYDIWTYRLKSRYDQFIFTSRTNGKEIKLKETELFPFLFIHPGIPVVFKSESGMEIVTPAQTAGTVCAMDMQTVLKQMPAGTKRIDVCPAGEYAFHFTVLPGKLSEERYLLRFRNSLGAFEVLEVTGRAIHTPEFSEESLYETLTDFDFYEERRSRVKSKGIIEVETGYKERREFPFVMDMIQSDEIYFIYPDGDSFRCHVKADSVQYRNLMMEPTSIKLKIREITEEEFSTPKIEFDISDIRIQVSPASVSFTENGGKQLITVTGNMNSPFEVINLPSWLHISNQTRNSFELTADRNNTEDEKTTQISVRLVKTPSISVNITVNQDGAWLSEFVFDVATSTANENVARIINLGAVESGEARFDYGDGTPVEVKPVPKSRDIQVTDNKGDILNVKVGTDFGHVFGTSGTHTVTVKLRNGVDALKFSSVPAGGSVLDWGAEYEPNPYIRTVRKIKSDYLESGSKMFAGCTRASFSSDFPGLETPNITNVDFMFENFGNYNSGDINNRLRFPANMYSHFSKKNLITGMKRTYYKSGFEKIEKSMLSCSANNTLLSAFETFRGMRNVGANWTAKYGNANASGQHIINYDSPSLANLELEEFVETDLFWNQSQIRDFTGCFNAINDFYGAYDSGYAYKWMLKKDLFKNNAAPYLILDAMFNKCTRVIMENGFFSDIAQKVHSMYLCFYAFNDGNPRVSGDMSIPGFNGADLKKMFPDSSYPNMGLDVPGVEGKCHIAGAFHFWPADAGNNDNLVAGFQELPFGISSPYQSNQLFNTDYFYWRYPDENLRKDNFSIASFLAKFPNVTASSGIDPRDGITVIDGAAYNFGNYTQQDDSGNKKLTDIDTFASSNPARAQVTQKVNLN